MHSHRRRKGEGGRGEFTYDITSLLVIGHVKWGGGAQITLIPTPFCILKSSAFGKVGFIRVLIQKSRDRIGGLKLDPH